MNVWSTINPMSGKATPSFVADTRSVFDVIRMNNDDMTPKSNRVLNLINEYEDIIIAYGSEYGSFEMMWAKALKDEIGGVYDSYSNQDDAVKQSVRCLRDVIEDLYRVHAIDDQMDLWHFARFYVDVLNSPTFHYINTEKPLDSFYQAYVIYRIYNFRGLVDIPDETIARFPNLKWFQDPSDGYYSIPWDVMTMEKESDEFDVLVSLVEDDQDKCMSSYASTIINEKADIYRGPRGFTINRFQLSSTERS